MGTIVALLLGGMALVFGLLPLLPLSRHTIRARPRFTPLELPELPTVQYEQIKRVVETLQKDGFTPETYLHLATGVTQSRKNFILLTNRNNRCAALVTITSAPPKAGQLPAAGDVEVTFQTRFTSGTVLETHNTRRLNYTPALPNEIRNFLPSVRDLHRLYQLHCFVIEENNLHIRDGKTMFDEGKATDFVIEMMEECCIAQETGGYLRRDAASREPLYRLTPKGAYLTTWNNLFPVTAGRWLVRLLREREVLEGFFRSPWGVALTR